MFSRYWIFTIAIFVSFKLTNAFLKLDCNDYNISNWDCDKYHFYFSPSNIENTLNCIGYKKHKYPNTAVTLRRKIRKLIAVYENHGRIEIYEVTELRLFEESLKFEFCEKKALHYISPYSELFWQPDVDTSRKTLFKMEFDRIKVSQVLITKIP